MSKSSKANMNELLATEFHQLRAQKIHRICVAMDVLVYGAEKVTTSKIKTISGAPEKGLTSCNQMVRS